MFVFGRHIKKRTGITRRQERFVYWILIVAQAVLSLVSMGMVSVKHFDVVDSSDKLGIKFAVDESHEENATISATRPEHSEVDARKKPSTRHKTDQIDEFCHLPNTKNSKYYESADDYDYDYDYDYAQSSEDSNDESEDIELGPCSYPYPTNIKPREGYLDGIDFYHLR